MSELCAVSDYEGISCVEKAETVTHCGGQDEQEMQQVKAEVTSGLRRTAREVLTACTQTQFSVRHQLW